MYKIGIVGFGKMGVLHGALVNAHSNAEIVAITEKSWFLRQGIKKLFPKIKCYSSYEKMLNGISLDAVIIATPAFNHVEIAKVFLQKKIHVFVEKPLSHTYAEALKLREVGLKNDSKLMVGFCCRYLPIMEKSKEIIESDIIGNIESVFSERFVGDILKEGKGWRYNKEYSGGGVLIDFTIHLLDLLIWFFGDVSTVKGHTSKIYSKEVEDETQFELFFEKGFNAIVKSSWSRPEHRKPFTKIEINGTKGKIAITEQTLEITYTENSVTKRQKYTNPDLYKGYYFDLAGASYSLQIDDFIKMLNVGNYKIKSSLNEALYTQQVVDCIYKSDRENRLVEV